MTEEERAALEAVQFNWAVAPEDVWSPVPHHVEGLHQKVARSLLRAVPRASGPAASPIGVVLEGERGVGKTHMLRWLRQQVQESGGYFFLLKLLEGTDFWGSAVHGVVDGFHGGQVDQLTPLLRRIAEIAGSSKLDQARVTGTIPVTRDALDALVAGVRQADPQLADSGNTLRALVLFRADRPAVHEIGYAYLVKDGDVEDTARETWGFRPGARSRQLVLRDLSRLLALTGPTVLAVDQIDPMLSPVTAALQDGLDGAPPPVVGALADGLMELREVTRRTLTVVACFPASWTLLTRTAVISAADRFRTETLQGAMPGSAVAAAIVGQHLGGLYADVGFDPPYPTWPVRPEAFAASTARTYTPRRLLQRVDEHIRACLDAGEVTELTDLTERPDPVDLVVEPDGSRLREFDEWFASLRDSADVDGPLEPDSEDERMPALLAAGLRAWVAELGEAGQAFAVDQVRGRKPPVHARLRRTLDEGREDEQHVAFRAIAHPHHRAVQSRLTAARRESALGLTGDRRQLVLLRNRDWPNGPVTARAVAEVEEKGGLAVPVGEADLRTFAALEAMQRPHRPGWLEWLTARRPASSTELFGRTLPTLDAPPIDATEPGGPDESAKTVATPRSVDDDQVDRPSPADHQNAAPRIRVGRSLGGSDVLVELESLRKHTAVFAGSGSGKTVLLRRLVEECALHGVSAIVLDPNNDLSRLGDAWPQPPESWFDGDAEKAADYLRHTEVVIWTPGRARGRPLTFQPLPDFAAVLDDDEELGLAVGSAVASLVPRAQLTGKKVSQGTAVLRESLHYFARNSGSSLGGLVDLLDELPDGISSLRNGQKLAEEMSEALRAAMINDPLFGGSGQAVDPSVLLTPSAGKRARISVLNFVGLPSDGQRQGFVNQLQMALFSWVKANPAGDRPLGGLFVMDEAQNFAPSGALTACTESTIALASQARKYGLGLVLATQAPKGLHNRVTGNAATQFFGFLNSGAQIAAARDLAQAKGGRVDDISRLTRGQFYVAAEGLAFEKVAEPMCLSFHPPSPPTEEEVLARAAAGRR